MAKKNVIIFDGEDKFINKKKHVYSKNKGVAAYVNVKGDDMVTNSTTTTESTPVLTAQSVQEPTPTTTSSVVTETIAPQAIQTGLYTPPPSTSTPTAEAITSNVTEAISSALQPSTPPSGGRKIPGIEDPEKLGNPTGAPNIIPNCGIGEVWDATQNMCVRSEVGGIENLAPPSTTFVNPLAGYEGQPATIEVKTPTMPCPANYVWDAITQQCVTTLYKDTRDAVISGGGEVTGAGGFTSKVAGDPEALNKMCPEGWTYDIANKRCVHPPCGYNQYWDEVSGTCVEFKGEIPKVTQPETYPQQQVEPQPQQQPKVATEKECIQYAFDCTTKQKYEVGRIMIPIDANCDNYQPIAGPCIENTTTSTTTTTTTQKATADVQIDNFGTPPMGGGGVGGGGGGGSEEAPKAVAKAKNYFWYYVAAGMIGFYLYKKFKK